MRDSLARGTSENFGWWLGQLVFQFAQAIEGNPENRWKTASPAAFRGDLLEAADLYADGGYLPEEAVVRVRTTRQLVAEGRHAEAEQQLGLPLAFWRSVGATRYIAGVEALRAEAAGA